MIPPALILSSLGIAGGLVGAVCVSSTAVPGHDTNGQGGAQSALGTPGNGDGRVFGIPVRANSGPLMTSAVVTAAPGDYVSKRDLGTYWGFRKPSGSPFGTPTASGRSSLASSTQTSAAPSRSESRASAASGGGAGPALRSWTPSCLKA